MSKLPQFVACSFLAWCLLGCRSFQSGKVSPTPPASFKEADLIGRWTTISDLHAQEILVLEEDHSFTQTYDTTQPKYHYAGQGTWSLETRPGGCTYIDLKSMRYYHLTREAAEWGNRYPDGSLILFIDPCEGQSITMPDKVVLMVRAQPNFPRGIMLLFPKASSETTDNFLRLDDATSK